MNNKETYRSLVNKNFSIFHQPFWLDAVANNNWDVAIILHDNKLKASMPYCYSNKYNSFQIIMPYLTQTLGPHLNIASAKYTNQLSEELVLIENLFNQLPKFSFYNQRWHYKYQNWLPCYWLNYKQTTKYTYVIENISDTKEIWLNFRENIRREIRKAEKSIQIFKSNDPENIYELMKQPFSKYPNGIPYSLNFLNNLYNQTHKNDASQIYIAKDSDNKIIASALIVWDNRSAYYLIGNTLKSANNSGAMSLILWTAINDLKDKTISFDFEGSMLQGVERYFRAFGAIQKSYFDITKYNGIIYKLKSYFKI